LRGSGPLHDVVAVCQFVMSVVTLVRRKGREKMVLFGWLAIIFPKKSGKNPGEIDASRIDTRSRTRKA
jgi:hypothetical protein